MRTAADDTVALDPIWRARFDAADRMAVQDAAIRAVQADPLPFYARFATLPQTLGGRFVSADSFKETFDAYRGHPAHRQRYNAPLHNTAAVLASAWLRHLLRQPRAPGRDTVILITGVPGAGKTSAVLAAAWARSVPPQQQRSPSFCAEPQGVVAESTGGCTGVGVTLNTVADPATLYACAPSAQDDRSGLSQGLFQGFPGETPQQQPESADLPWLGVHAVYEGQLAKPETALAKVQAVLDAGLQPFIVALHPTPERALENTLRRFAVIGRGASIHNMARLQGDLPDGLAAVRDTFGQAVALRIIDRRDFDHPQLLAGWAQWPVLTSEGNREHIQKRLEKHLDILRGHLSRDAWRQASGLTPE